MAVVEVAREASTEATGELVTRAHFDTALAQLESRLASRLVTVGIVVAAVVVAALPPMDYDEIHDRTVRRLVKSVYNQCLINNAERGAYVEHMIALAIEGQGWDLTWPWASWDLHHRDIAGIEFKQSAARQPWHNSPWNKVVGGLTPVEGVRI